MIDIFNVLVQISIRRCPGDVNHLKRNVMESRIVKLLERTSKTVQQNVQMTPFNVSVKMIIISCPGDVNHLKTNVMESRIVKLLEKMKYLVQYLFGGGG